jgi:hypothetical protein
MKFLGDTGSRRERGYRGLKRQMCGLLSRGLRFTMEAPTQEFSPNHEYSPRSRTRARRVVSNDAATDQILVDRSAAVR